MTSSHEIYRVSDKSLETCCFSRVSRVAGGRTSVITATRLFFEPPDGSGNFVTFQGFSTLRSNLEPVPFNL